MSLWKLINARWGSGAGETDEVRIDASTNSLQTIEYEHHEIHSGSSYYYEGHVTLDDGDPDAATGMTRIKLVTPSGTKWGHWTWQISSNATTEISIYEGPTGGMTAGARGVIHANNRNGEKNCWSGVSDGDSATVLTDATQAWTPDALIGMQVYNQTDGSAAFITDNDATTVTVVALLGGTDNEWDTDDIYEINNSRMTVTGGVAIPVAYGLELTSTKYGGTGFKTDIGGGTNRAHEIVGRADTTYLAEITSSTDANIVTYSFSWYEHTDKH